MKWVATMLIGLSLICLFGTQVKSQTSCSAVDDTVGGMCAAEQIHMSWSLVASEQIAALPIMKRLVLLAPALLILLSLISLVRTAQIITASDRLPRSHLYKDGLFLPYLYPMRAP